MSGTPSLALSIRIEPVRRGAYRGRRRHDLREGPQPKYVDAARSHLNSVILAAPTAGVIRAESVRRRSGRNDVRRAMRDDVAIATSGVITWGRALQAHVLALSSGDQDALYRAVADAVANHCGSTLAGLAVHRDEVAPHAHLWMPSFALDGRPISHRLSRGDMSRLQDVAMEAARPWLPMIEPPVRKAARIERGDDASAIYHRSVAQLHADLPAELEAADARLVEMQDRVAQLEALAVLTDREVRRLETYRRREADRQVALDVLRASLDAREDALVHEHVALMSRARTLDAAEVQVDAREDELDRREDDLGRREDDMNRTIEVAAKVAAQAAVEAVVAVIEGRIAPDPNRTGSVRVDAELRSRLTPIWRAIGPALVRLSYWWEGLRGRLDALPDAERRAVIDGGDGPSLG